MSEPSDDN